MRIMDGSVFGINVQFGWTLAVKPGETATLSIQYSTVVIISTPLSQSWGIQRRQILKKKRMVKSETAEAKISFIWMRSMGQAPRTLDPTFLIML